MVQRLLYPGFQENESPQFFGILGGVLRGFELPLLDSFLRSFPRRRRRGLTNLPSDFRNLIVALFESIPFRSALCDQVLAPSVPCDQSPASFVQGDGQIVQGWLSRKGLGERVQFIPLRIKKTPPR